MYSTVSLLFLVDIALYKIDIIEDEGKGFTNGGVKRGVVFFLGFIRNTTISQL